MGKAGWETTRAEFDETVALNMAGCFDTTRGCAGRMACSASKWGLRGITKSMALEAGPYGINVNLVAPGMMQAARSAARSSCRPA